MLSVKQSLSLCGVEPPHQVRFLYGSPLFKKRDTKTPEKKNSLENLNMPIYESKLVNLN